MFSELNSLNLFKQSILYPPVSLEEAELGLELGLDKSSGFVSKNWCSFFDWFDEDIEVEEQGDGNEDRVPKPFSKKL